MKNEKKEEGRKEENADSDSNTPSSCYTRFENNTIGYNDTM